LAEPISKAKIAVFLSGGGSNLQAIIDASKAGILNGEVVLVISNMRKAYGLVRAEKEGIDTFVFKIKKYDTPEKGFDDLLAKLKKYDVEYIALAGYLKLLPENVIQSYKGKIVNIHPALLPKYGGKGMYGHFVHEAVIESGDTESGITIHLADEIYDNGKILHQVKVPVEKDDTPDILAARVLKQEHLWYPRVLDKLIKGEYRK